MEPFIVNYKDLVNKKKNPNLSLSAKDIAENPNIPKKKWGEKMKCMYCGQEFSEEDFGSNCKKCRYTLLPEEYKEVKK